MHALYTHKVRGTSKDPLDTPSHPTPPIKKKKDIFQDFNFGGINYVITYNYGDNYSPYISIDPVRSRTNFVATQPHHTFTHYEFVN